MNKTYSAYASLAGAQILVGSSVVAGRLMVSELPVCAASLVRFVLASACLLPILLWTEGWPRLSLRSHALLAAMSLCGSFLFTVFLLTGLKYTSPATAGIITGTTPAMVALLGWALFRERPGRAAMLGVVLCAAGAALVQAGGLGDVGMADAWKGNLLVLGAVVFESLFLLMRKAGPEPISAMATSTLAGLWGLAWFLVPGLIQLPGVDFQTVGSVGYGSLIYYGLFVTVAAYLLWFNGITRVSAAVAGGITALMPVSALLLSIAVLGEAVGWPQAAGCALVFLGILSISRPR